jgi:positive regulator of sigma E activity
MVGIPLNVDQRRPNNPARGALLTPKLMHPEFFTGSGFFWLAVFMTVGVAVNKARGRPVANGALVYCWVVSVPIVVLVIAAALRPGATEATVLHLTELVGGLFLPYLVGFYFARKYTARNAKSKDERIAEASTQMSPAEQPRKSRTLVYVALLLVLVGGLLLTTSHSIDGAIARMLPLLLMFAVAALCRFAWPTKRRPSPPKAVRPCASRRCGPRLPLACHWR